MLYLMLVLLILLVFGTFVYLINESLSEKEMINTYHDYNIYKDPIIVHLYAIYSPFRKPRKMLRTFSDKRPESQVILKRLIKEANEDWKELRDQNKTKLYEED